MNAVVTASPFTAVIAATKFLLRLAVTGLILFVVLRAIDVDQIGRTLMRADPWLLFAALLLQLASAVVAAWRWQLVMRNLGFGQDFGFYCRSFFKGLFFSQGLPTSIGGDALRMLDVAARGFRKRDALYAIAIDRVAGLGALLVLTLCACVASPTLLPQKLYWLVFLLVSAGLLGLAGGFRLALRRGGALLRFLTLLDGPFLVGRRFRYGDGYESQHVGVVKAEVSFKLGYGSGERLEDNDVVNAPAVVLYLVRELSLSPFVELYYLPFVGGDGVAEPLLYLCEVLFLDVGPDNV